MYENYSFGRFFQQYSAPSLLDPLLEKKDVTLEQILDEENILNEIKNMGGNKFANFIIKHPDMFKQMIWYIIHYDESVIDKKRIIQQQQIKTIRYQFMISEILGNENSKLVDFMFGKEDKSDDTREKSDDATPENDDTADVHQVQEPLHKYELLTQLFSLLEQDSLCVTTAGYFQKVVLPLIRKRGHELWEYLKDNQRIINNFIKHLDENHIAELVGKLIILDTQSDNNEENYFDERLALLKRVMTYVAHKPHSHEIVENSCDILNEIVQRGKITGSIYNSTADVHLLIDTIKSRVLQIFTLGEQSQQAGPYSVLCSLLEHQERGEQVTPQDEDTVNTEQEIPDYTNFLDILQHLSAACLQTSLYNGEFVDAGGVSIQPLGLAKIQVVKLIEQLLSLKNQQINQKLSETDIFKTLIDLVNKYKSHNQLHLLFEKIVHLTIEQDQQQLIDNLFYAGFLDFIASEYQNKHDFGSRGILTKISNYVHDKSQSHTKIKDFITQSIKFQQLLVTPLKQINKHEQEWLCGVNPRQKPNYEEDDFQQESDVQKILEVFKASYEQRFNHPRQKQQEEEVQEVLEVIDTPNGDEKILTVEEEVEVEVKSEFLINHYWKMDIVLDQEEIDKLMQDYK